MIETKLRKISLKGQDKAIVEAKKQLMILEGELFESDLYPKFSSKLKVQNNFPLKVKKLEIFQVNIGYMCNQVCEHCHVDAGPDRKEIMTKDTMGAVFGSYKKIWSAYSGYYRRSTRNESKL